MLDRAQSISLSAEELQEVWPILSRQERLDGFRLLPQDAAEQFFLSLSPRDQADLLVELSPAEGRAQLRLVPPDDLADLVQALEPAHAEAVLGLMDAATRREVKVLLAYAEDDAGGLMNPRFARVRPEMTVDEAIGYVRKQASEKVETVYYLYVLDSAQRILGVLSLRELFRASPGKRVADIMQRDVVTVSEDTDQEDVGRLFASGGWIAIPVIDAEQRMKGIVTADDIIQVVEAEATEDIQKFGGMEALHASYFTVGFFDMLKKRAGWLLILFVSEMLTTTAMSHFESEIARAVVLTLFIPLIMSSGGNSGSQATTLIIRSLALGDLRVGDWWRVAWRELRTGLALGAVLGAVGLTRILLWHELFGSYGTHALLVGVTVALSLIGVVLWGTFAGSMLPFVLRRLKFDPASASAPFVATLVDVSALVIYFSVASLVLRGILL